MHCLSSVNCHSEALRLAVHTTAARLLSYAEHPYRPGPGSAQRAPHQIDGAVLTHAQVAACLEHCVCLPVYAHRAQVMLPHPLLTVRFNFWPGSSVPICMNTVLLLHQSPPPGLGGQPLPANARGLQNLCTCISTRWSCCKCQVLKGPRSIVLGPGWS